MNPGVARPLDAKARPALPARAAPARKSRLLWIVSGVLVLLLAGMLYLAFSLGADDSAPASGKQNALATPVATNPAAIPDGVADSGEIVVDRLPGPPPREINGTPVDADGNSLDPNLTGPGDDSPFQKDGDDNADDNNNDNKASAPR